MTRLLVHNKSGARKLKHAQLAPNFRLLSYRKTVQLPYRRNGRAMFAGYAMDGLASANCGR